MALCIIIVIIVVVVIIVIIHNIAIIGVVNIAIRRWDKAIYSEDGFIVVIVATICGGCSSPGCSCDVW